MYFAERLSALDACFLALEDAATHMHVAAVLIFDARPLKRADGGLDVERIHASIAAQLPGVPRYRQKLASVPLAQRPVWVDDPTFNLHYHVRDTCLPPPGDERLLKRLAGRIMSQKLDRGKPLWEAWVVEGLEGDRFALVVKAHQCMLEGVSGIGAIAALLRPLPEDVRESGPRWFPRPTPSGSQLLADEVRHRVRTPFAWLARARDALRDPRAAIESARSTASAIGDTVAAGVRPASRTPFNPAHIGPHRRLDWTAFDLDEVDRIRRRLDGTFDDVVLATAAGAIGRYLKQRRIRVDGMDFRALVPVDLRPDPERGTPRRVAMLLAELPIDEPDPRRRLRHVVETTRRLKRSAPVRGPELLEGLSDWTPPVVMNRLVRTAGRMRAFNLVVTHVAGPGDALDLSGAPLLAPYPVVPLPSNQALGIALFSYRRGLYWGLNSDWDRLPDLHTLVEALAIEFEQLRKAAEPPRSEPLASEASEGKAAEPPRSEPLASEVSETDAATTPRHDPPRAKPERGGVALDPATDTRGGRR